MDEADVLIVGGGFVGLALAAALDGGGWRVTLLDKGERPDGDREQDGAAVKRQVKRTGASLATDYSANVIAVSPWSQRFLADLGAWQRLPADAVTPFAAMQVYDGTGTGAIAFHAEEEGMQQLGYIVPQPALRAALCQGLEETGAVRLLWGRDWLQAVQQEQGYRMTLAEGDIFARLLVAADGAASDLRDLAGLKSIGWDYAQQALVCIAQTDEAHGQTARQWFTETGPLAFLPLADKRLVAVIWSCTDARDKLALADAGLCTALTDASEAMLGNVLAVTQRLSFPLSQRHLLNYAAARLAVLGDAAHSIHPLAGQGANLGFADAAALAGALREAALAGKPPGDPAALRRYVKARRRDNHLAGIAMEAFHRLYAFKSPSLRLARNLGLSLVDAQPRLKRLAVQAATRPGTAPTAFKVQDAS